MAWALSVSGHTEDGWKVARKIAVVVPTVNATVTSAPKVNAGVLPSARKL